MVGGGGAHQREGGGKKEREGSIHTNSSGREKEGRGRREERGRSIDLYQCTLFSKATDVRKCPTEFYPPKTGEKVESEHETIL